MMGFCVVGRKASMRFAPIEPYVKFFVEGRSEMRCHLQIICVILFLVASTFLNTRDQIGSGDAGGIVDFLDHVGRECRA